MYLTVVSTSFFFRTEDTLSVLLSCPTIKKDFRLLIKAISTPGKLEKEETGVNIILTKIVYQIKRIDINYSIPL